MHPTSRRLLAQAPLTRGQEAALARQSRRGDAAARSRLIEAGMRSVVLRALMLGFRDDALDDAVQAGAVGLITAVDRFDPDRGARLATFAWRWVGAAMVATRDEPAAPASEHHVDDPGWTVLDGLAPHLADVIRLRFGESRDAAPLTRREAASRLGVTVSRVRTWEQEAMRHLRGDLAKISDRASAPPEPVLYSSIGRAADC